MRMTRSPKLLISSLALGAGLVTSVATAQEDSVVVDVRFAGLANIEAHAKDQAAHKAIMLLGERLAEVPGETGGPPEASKGIELVWDLIRGAHALRIDRVEQAPGLGLSFTLVPEAPHDGQSYLADFAQFSRDTGGPIQEGEEGYLFETPIGNLTLRAEDVAGKSSMVARLGAEEAAQTAVQTFDLPTGSSAILSAQIHLQRLGNFVAQMIAEEEPEFGEIIEKYRWVIDEAPLMNVAYGNTSSHQLLTSRLVSGKPWLSRLGMNPEHTFSEDDFAIIPMDATIVSAFPFELGFILDFVDAAIEEAGERDPFVEINEQLGFDVRGDVLENVGPRMFYYQSDTTGGGGFLSAVLITELHDPARLAKTHGELVERLNGMAAQEARGYVRIRPWELDGQTIFSLATPGLPVPFEPSWTIAGDRLVIATSPVGISGAVRQLASSGMSINDNSDFREAILKHLPEGGAASATFSDTARFAKQGYSGTNLLLSGLANAVRSPSDPSREPGILMPEFSKFAAGIHPMGAVEYWDGDDYVSVMRMDGSSIVGVSEMLGQIGGLNGVVALTAMQVSTAMPALGRARENAKSVKSATQVRALGQAIIVYSMNNDGKLPPSYDVLIDEGFITADMLVSPMGTAWDGKGDIVMRTTIDPALIDSYRADVVVTLDRAAYINGGQFVNVGFADNHIESLSVWEVDDYLNMEINAGAREDFMLDE